MFVNFLRTSCSLVIYFCLMLVHIVYRKSLFEVTGSRPRMTDYKLYNFTTMMTNIGKINRSKSKPFYTFWSLEPRPEMITLQLIIIPSNQWQSLKCHPEEFD